MSKPWLHDNDVVVKVCAYRLLDELGAAWGTNRPSILRTSTYSLPAQVSGNRRIEDRSGAEAELSRFLGMADVVEPEPEEIALAAELEEEAIRRALPLDGGESQLVAILACRAVPILVTGDKRAIVALNSLGKLEVHGRLACLEQVAATLVRQSGCDAVRYRVCAEPAMDKALTNCFACASDATTDESILEGLGSYVRHLRASSGELLLPGEDLSAVVS